MLDLTPQQQKFLEYYIDPQSETWSNATQSAIKAGYSKDYADNIMALRPDWLSESIGDNELVKLAMGNLKTALGGGFDLPDGPKNIQYKATENTLKSLLNKKFGDKKNIDVTTKGEKITVNEEMMQIALRYEEELKQKL